MRYSAPRLSLGSSSIRRAFSTTLSRDATWGFIGLGQMGYSMAKNLRAKVPPSDTLIIRDVNPETTERFVAESKELAKSSGAGEDAFRVEVSAHPREVAEKSTVVISSLPEPQHVKDVFYNILKPGKLPTLEEERLFIDTSTIDPPSSREVANVIHGTGSGVFVDAPMSGGVIGARAGTLTFMFGASSNGEVVKRATSILLLMGKSALHLGPQGSGLAGKLANNYILAINNIAAAEAMNLGIRWGLDPKVLAGLVSSSTGRSWPMDVNNPVPGVVDTAPSSHGYEGGFGISLMNKDLRLAIAAAEESATPLTLGATAREVYNAAEEQYRGKDFSVVYKWLLDKSE